VLLVDQLIPHPIAAANANPTLIAVVVTVVVLAIAELCRPWENKLIVIVAVCRLAARGEAVAVLVETLVDSTVAVVVDAITQLGRIGADVLAGVVTIGRKAAARDLIAVEIEVLVEPAITVVVQAITELTRPRIDAIVGIVAVGRERVPIVVVVDVHRHALSLEANPAWSADLVLTGSGELRVFTILLRQLVVRFELGWLMFDRRRPAGKHRARDQQDENARLQAGLQRGQY
jgi:hypothetical protein